MPNKNAEKARGRPRSFDESAVLRQAQLMFLQQGFEAASYDGVAATLGLSKPSLYNAFGDKTAFFERAVADYAEAARAQIIANFGGAANLAEAGRKLLLAAADVYSSPEGPSTGCLLVGTALPSCVTHEGPRRTLSDFIAALEASLEEAIERHHAKDVARTGKSARALALQVSSLLFALAVRARTGLSRRKLRATAAELAGLIG